MRCTTWTSDRMFVSYRQYYLQGDEFLSEYDDSDTVRRIFAGNSLAAGGPEHLTVLAGTHTGWIRLTTRQSADEPPLPGEEWETVVDVSIYSTSGSLWLFRWGGDVEEDAGNFATAGAGWYRVRVQARGRDEGAGHAEDTPVEEHTLSVWPAPPAPDTVHRANDAFARAHYDPTRAPGQPVQP
ncbi:hypothetical protein JHN63_23205 [Streptomyces sp. MBT65]|uniref:hypothetical protein n=1 Tax=Streptomyces sp. MBT65 TaxID=1488395 RepID=UPI001909E0AA|nr:hypothetical protein [Streptomyces sp. MBT65]MBK3576661.1 hypothetical protein [Streptomyces sp. MBT65]